MVTAPTEAATEVCPASFTPPAEDLPQVVLRDNEAVFAVIDIPSTERLQRVDDLEDVAAELGLDLDPVLKSIREGPIPEVRHDLGASL